MPRDRQFGGTGGLQLDNSDWRYIALPHTIDSRNPTDWFLNQFLEERALTAALSFEKLRAWEGRSFFDNAHPGKWGGW
jgi:hypothetical protein